MLLLLPPPSTHLRNHSRSHKFNNKQRQRPRQHPLPQSLTLTPTLSRNPYLPPYHHRNSRRSLNQLSPLISQDPPLHSRGHGNNTLPSSLISLPLLLPPHRLLPLHFPLSREAALPSVFLRPILAPCLLLLHLRNPLRLPVPLAIPSVEPLVPMFPRQGR